MIIHMLHQEITLIYLQVDSKVHLLPLNLLYYFCLNVYFRNCPEWDMWIPDI